jgi:DNA polymerase-3 subunit delta'
MLNDVVGQEQAVSFLRRVVAGKVTTPLLLIGDEGVGRRFSVIETIREILLADRGDGPEIVQLQRGVHPDVEIVAASGDKDIGVEPIRNMVEHAQHYPTASPNRFFVVDGVDRMTPAAANAILKTLEDQPAASRFFLLAESNDRVLRTIRTRCGRVHFQRLPESFVRSKVSVLEKDHNKALVYTRMSEGSVGRATRYWGANRLALRDRVFNALKFGLNGDLPSAFAICDEVANDLPLGLKFLRFITHDILVQDVDPARLINVDLIEDLRAMRSQASQMTWSQLSAELRLLEERYESSHINLIFHVKTAFVSALSGV